MTWKRVLFEFARRIGYREPIMYNGYHDKSDSQVEMDQPSGIHSECIHNLTGYYQLCESNTKKWRALNKRLHRRYGVYFDEEVLKEIALDRLFRESTVNDIDHLLSKQEQIPKIEGEMK